MHKRVFTQTFVVAGAIIEQDGKILLVQEARGSERGTWNQPAGWVDPGEDPAVAAAREVREETGLDFKPEAILGVYSIVKERLRAAQPGEPRPDGRDTVEAGVPHGFKILYRGTFSGDVGGFEDEVVAARWFTPAEIQAMDSTMLRDADIPQEVNDYFAGTSYPLNLVHHHVQK